MCRVTKSELESPSYNLTRNPASDTIDLDPCRYTIATVIMDLAAKILKPSDECHKSYITFA